MQTLLRKAKMKYYTDLKMSGINDDKKFWKNVKCKCEVFLVIKQGK